MPISQMGMLRLKRWRRRAGTRLHVVTTTPEPTALQGLLPTMSPGHPLGGKGSDCPRCPFPSVQVSVKVLSVCRFQLDSALRTGLFLQGHQMKQQGGALGKPT